MRRRAHPLRLHVWDLRLHGDAVGGGATLISPPQCCPAGRAVRHGAHPPRHHHPRVGRGADDGRRNNPLVRRRPMHPRCSLAALAVMLALASVALATDHPIAGDFLFLKDPMSAANPRVRFKATRETAIDPSQAGDPRALGATLEIAGESTGDGMTGPIALDPMLWTGLGSPAGSRGYKYFDRSRSTGVRKVAFRSGARGGALMVSGGGSAWPYQITQAQGPIDVRFTIGADVYCAAFVSFRRDEAGRGSAKDAPAPPDCSGPPPTTCGNGVVEATEECDEGTTPSGDGCSASRQRENTPARCP